jgi:SAM-dependent methyltransferase
MTTTQRMNELLTFERGRANAAEPTAETARSEPGYRGALARDWDKIGQLQIDYLIGAGLRPQDRVLDLGCGALRGGGKIINYLDDGHYYGIDMDKHLLNAGHREELGRLGLQGKCPRRNLFCSGLFRHERLGEKTIDVGLSVSVMRELTVNYLRIMLENAAPYFRPGGVLHCSYFELGAAKSFSHPYTNMARHKTFGNKSPYHHYRRDIEHAAIGTRWDCRHFGDWQHPDGEVMMVFTIR